MLATPLLQVVIAVDDQLEGEWLETVAQAFVELAHELDPAKEGRRKAI